MAAEGEERLVSLRARRGVVLFALLRRARTGLLRGRDCDPRAVGQCPEVVEGMVKAPYPDQARPSAGAGVVEDQVRARSVVADLPRPGLVGTRDAVQRQRAAEGRELLLV